MQNVIKLLPFVSGQDSSLTIKFLLIPSHVGVAASDTDDLPAKKYLRIACLVLPSLPSVATNKWYTRLLFFPPSTARTLSSLRVHLYGHTTTSLHALRRTINTVLWFEGTTLCLLYLGCVTALSGRSLKLETFLTSPPASCVTNPMLTVFTTTVFSLSVRHMLPQGRPRLDVWDSLLTETNVAVILVRNTLFVDAAILYAQTNVSCFFLVNCMGIINCFLCWINKSLFHHFEGLVLSLFMCPACHESSVTRHYFLYQVCLFENNKSIKTQ